jgi:hypothetical protein
MWLMGQGYAGRESLGTGTNFLVASDSSKRPFFTLNDETGILRFKNEVILN